MNINDITTLIGSLGFPIIMCIVLFNYITKLNEYNKNESERHKQEMMMLRDSIDNNTIVIRNLVDTLSRKGVINE